MVWNQSLQRNWRWLKETTTPWGHPHKISSPDRTLSCWNIPCYFHPNLTPSQSWGLTGLRSLATLSKTIPGKLPYKMKTQNNMHCQNMLQSPHLLNELPIRSTQQGTEPHQHRISTAGGNNWRRQAEMFSVEFDHYTFSLIENSREKKLKTARLYFLMSIAMALFPSEACFWAQRASQVFFAIT